MNLIVTNRPGLDEKMRLDPATTLVFPVIEDFIPNDLDHALQQIKQGDWHYNILTPARVMRLELLQATRPQQSFREVFREVWHTWQQSGCVTGTFPSFSALVQARSRVPLWAFERLFKSMASKLLSSVTHPICPEHRLLSIDGVPLILPHTPALLEHFGTTHSQHGDAYYPQASAVWIAQLPTRGIIAQWVGSISQTDQTVAPYLLPATLQPGDLVLGDGHYGTFPVQSVIQAAQAFYLVRASGTLVVDKHVSHRYSEQECDLQLRPTPSTRCAYRNFNFPEYLCVRALNLSIPSRDQLNGMELATFLTNLPRSQFPLERINQLSALRWNQETIHNDVKTRLGLGEIRSQTEPGVRREILSHLCCSNLLRLLTFGSPELSVSFTAALSALRQANQHLRLRPAEHLRITQLLLDLIRQQPLDVRPGRSEPRMCRPRKRPYPIFKTPRLEWRQKRKAG